MLNTSSNACWACCRRCSSSACWSSCLSICCPATRHGSLRDRMPTRRRSSWCGRTWGSIGRCRSSSCATSPACCIGTSVSLRTKRRSPARSATVSCRRSGSPGSMVWSVLFGMAIGIMSAVWRNRWPDRLGMTLAVSGISFPAFALGMVLMQIFSVQLGWLPTVGDDTWRHYILPSHHARRRSRGDHGALHPLVVRRDSRRGLHPHRARQGRAERRVVIKHGCAMR